MQATAKHRPPYCCHHCGASCYRQVIARDSTGALKPTGLFHCTGCAVVFADLRAWCEGTAAAPAAASAGPAAASRLAPVPARRPPTRPAARPAPGPLLSASPAKRPH